MTIVPGAKKIAVNKIITVLPSWHRQSKWRDRYESNHHTYKCTSRNVAILAKKEIMGVLTKSSNQGRLPCGVGVWTRWS